MNVSAQWRGLAMLLAVCAPPLLPAQTSSAAENAARQGGGSSTGAPQAAVFDAEHRPITIGGTVKQGPVVFQNVAAAAGLTGWHHTMGTAQKMYILETLGSGVGLIDYDNDGWLDIYLVNGSTYDALAGKATPPHAALFRNNHNGTFTDVTTKAGVSNDRWGFGVAVADFDNDGWPDLYVTNFGKNRLYRNNHDGTFTDVAEQAGVALGNWSTGATWGDYDGDGRLDLFVPGYLHYDIADPPKQGSKQMSYRFCEFRGVRVMCGPRGLKGEPDHLFHNNGDGTFTDVSLRAGVDDSKAPNYGLASVFIDIDNDGRVDLAVANDSTPNGLFRNNGKGGFEDIGYASGYALNADGHETASMGIAYGDLFHHGRIDLYNTTFSDDYKPLYRNDGDDSFTDVSYAIGIATSAIPFLGWGAGFFDYDNNGWLDIFEVNGHVYPEVERQAWGTTLKQRPLLYGNVGGKFEIVPAVEGTALAEATAGRGMAFGDIFNDGKIDVVINNLDGTPSLLKNVTADMNHWVELRLVGTGKTPRDAMGTTVYLTANGVRQRADVVSGGSFASSSDPRVHFGLGSSTGVEAIEIHWLNGAVQTLKLPGVDKIFTVVEGSGLGKR